MILQVVVRVVLSNDLDNDAHTDCQWVATLKHEVYQLLQTLLGHQLARKLVGPDDGLILCGSVCGYGDDGLEEVTSGCLCRSRLFGGEERDQTGYEVLLVTALASWLKNGE